MPKVCLVTLFGFNLAIGTICSLIMFWFLSFSYILLDTLTELKDLRNLELLDLSGNNFIGSVPGSIYVNCHCLCLLSYILMSKIIVELF